MINREGLPRLLSRVRINFRHLLIGQLLVVLCKSINLGKFDAFQAQIQHPDVATRRPE